MANFRAGKLAKKEEWPFSEQSSKEKNGKLFRFSQNKKSFESLDDAGRRVVEGSTLVCFLFSPKRS